MLSSSFVSVAGATRCSCVTSMRPGRSGESVKTSVSAIPQNGDIAQLAGHYRGTVSGAWCDSNGLIKTAQRGLFLRNRVTGGLTSRWVQELWLYPLGDGCIRCVGDVLTYAICRSIPGSWPR